MKQKNMRVIFMVLLFVFVSVNVYVEGQVAGSEYLLSEKELEDNIKKGLAGDLDALTKLWLYYAYAPFLEDEYRYHKFYLVSEFGAEQGEVISQYNVAYDLVESHYKIVLHNHPNTDRITRAVYWLKDPIKNKVDHSLSFLENNKLPVKSPFDCDSKEFIKKDNSKLTEYEIKVLTDYALRGGKKEAYSLYKYFLNYKKDKDEAHFWLKISAQNHDLQSEYEYGKYLIEKGNIKSEKDFSAYNDIRGLYWVKRAAKNGSKEAKEYLKKL